MKAKHICEAQKSIHKEERNLVVFTMFAGIWLLLEIVLFVGLLVHVKNVLNPAISILIQCRSASQNLPAIGDLWDHPLSL